jgi:hypothetical protein
MPKPSRREALGTLAAATIVTNAGHGAPVGTNNQIKIENDSRRWTSGLAVAGTGMLTVCSMSDWFRSSTRRHNLSPHFTNTKHPRRNYKTVTSALGES